MIAITCPCGRTLQAPDSAVGKIARCKTCGTKIPIVVPPKPLDDPPEAPPIDLGIDDSGIPLSAPAASSTSYTARRFFRSVAASIAPAFSPTAFAPAAGPAASQTSSVPPIPAVPAPASAGSRPAGTIPREPWYYKFLVIYATIVFWAGFIQFAVTILVLLLSMVAAPILVQWVSVAVSLWSIAIFFGTTMTSAPVLLAVDVARNIRAIRYRIRK
jgi:hypothetical protein